MVKKYSLLFVLFGVVFWFLLLAQAIGVPAGLHLGGLATTLVATFSFLFPPFFSSVVSFSHRGCAQINKKLTLQRLTGALKNLGVYQTLSAIFGPLSPIFDFAGSERVPVAPLGWYFV